LFFRNNIEEGLKKSIIDELIVKPQVVDSVEINLSNFQNFYESNKTIELKINDDIALNAPEAETLDLLDNGSVSSRDDLLSQNEGKCCRIFIYMENFI
jgi:hypothetical protein